MARFVSFPYSHGDLESVLELLSIWRVADPRHRLVAYPTTQRLGLLLTSRLWTPERDAALWKDDTGQLVSFAALWSRSRDDDYRVLEGPFVHPGLSDAECGALEATIVAWARRQAEELSQERSVPTTLSCMARQDDTARRIAIERWGFRLHVAAGNVYFERDLNQLPGAPLPAGFSARGIHDEVELERYEALYGFSAVDRAHRLALLRDPEYAHLVVVAPDDVFAAYCEVSICRREWTAGSARIGWIQYVGTHDDYLRRGLGRAALLAGLAHLRAWGAERAMLITIPTNEPANALYDATGFIRSAYEDVFVWRP
ncbi:MAG TPA: GNAT family N-acetyltransferase [Ktedonobacterales bacterium]